MIYLQNMYQVILSKGKYKQIFLESFGKFLFSEAP